MANVREATFELFRAQGMTTIFGNPGSTELPMLAGFPEDPAYNMPGIPDAWKELPPTSAALLIELRAEDQDQLGAPERAALEIPAGRALLSAP
jgi:hypothetical protein